MSSGLSSVGRAFDCSCFRKRYQMVTGSIPVDRSSFFCLFFCFHNRKVGIVEDNIYNQYIGIHVSKRKTKQIKPFETTAFPSF
jgi:hypothetical protein